MAGERKAAKQRTRRALIDAAFELFSESGLDGPSLDAICERAGYTRGAFYVHFADRDELIVAVMEEAGPPILDELIAADSNEDLATLFTRFLAAFADGSYPLAPRGGIRAHQFIDACIRSPKVGQRYVELVVEAMARVAHGVERGQQGGQLRDDVDAQAIAALLVGAIIGSQTMSELGVPYDFSATAAAALRMLLPGAEGDA
ncbi:MAG: TetR/AcrR family transcriptional regulator [Myxococcota bacterium]